MRNGEGYKDSTAGKAMSLKSPAVIPQKKKRVPVKKDEEKVTKYFYKPVYTSNDIQYYQKFLWEK